MMLFAWIAGLAVAMVIAMWLITRWVQKGSKTPHAPDERMSPYDDK
jgi:hypothetical protein